MSGSSATITLWVTRSRVGAAVRILAGALALLAPAAGASAGTTERVSVDSGGNEANGESRFRPAISADGSFVAFNSAATDLVVGDSNNLIDVFVHDRRRAAADTAPPPQTDGRPAGTQPAGTTHATITSRTAP